MHTWITRTYHTFWFNKSGVDVDTAGLRTKLFCIRFEKKSSDGLQWEKGPADGTIIEPRPLLGADGTGSVPSSTYRNTGFPKLEGAALAWQSDLESRERKEALGAAGVGEESVALNYLISFHWWFLSKEGSDLFLHTCFCPVSCQKQWHPPQKSKIPSPWWIPKV